jgi:hypothetical protein
MATNLPSKVNASRWHFVWSKACNKKCHRQSLFSMLAGHQQIIYTQGKPTNISFTLTWSLTKHRLRAEFLNYLQIFTCCNNFLVGKYSTELYRETWITIREQSVHSWRFAILDWEYISCFCQTHSSGSREYFRERKLHQITYLWLFRRYAHPSITASVCLCVCVLHANWWAKFVLLWQPE